MNENVFFSIYFEMFLPIYSQQFFWVPFSNIKKNDISSRLI